MSIRQLDNGLYQPTGEFLFTIGDLSYKDGKAPSQEYGGWPSAEPSSKNADWDHEGTWVNGDTNLNELPPKLEEKSRTAFLLDIDGANLLVFDYDVDKEEWDSQEELDAYIDEHYPGQTVWSTQSGGRHVPVLLTDEAFTEVFDNEWSTGYGVDSLKGPAAKGYTASPFSPGYGVVRTGGMPLMDVDDLEECEAIERSGVTHSSSSTHDFEPVIGREEAHSLSSTDDVEELFAAINQLRPGDFDTRSKCHGDRGDGTVVFNPSWRVSETGESLQWLSDEGVFWDAKEGKGMFADKLIALEEGIINSVHDELEGGDWSDAVDALRDRNAPIPILEDDPFSTFDGRTPSMAKRKRSHKVSESDRARITRIENARDKYLLNVLNGDYEIELPMRIGKSGHAAEGACPEDQRLCITPNKGDARDSYREHGPDNQIETIPSTDSWLADEEQVGEVVANEFMRLISGEFQAARARSMLIQKYDLEEPDSQPYFEQYDEEPTADLILTSPGVEAVEHWNENVDSVIWDDVHPLIHYTDMFRLDDTEWKSGIRSTLDKLVRALPVEPNSLEALLEDPLACNYVVNTLSLVTSQNPDQDQFNLMELCARPSNPTVTHKTWKRLMLVIEAETGLDATDPEIRVAEQHPDGTYVQVRVPFFPDDLNMVIMSGDNVPLLTAWWFELCGRDSPESVGFDARTLQAYWRSLNHTAIIADDAEGTRSGGNISAKKSSKLEDFARETFGDEHGEPFVLDSLKSFKRRGVSKEEVRESDSMMNFGNTRGNDAADERTLGVMHGSSHWPGFVETMTTVLGKPAVIEQHANEPAKAVDPETGEEHEKGQELLLWMKQAEPTQAAARVGSATDEPSVVVCGTRHIGPQFDAYDVSDDVHLLSDAEIETLDMVRDGFETISGVAGARGVTEQAAGHVLNQLADRGLLEKSAYAGDYGSHEYEGGDNRYIFTVPSENWKPHSAPLSGIVQTGSQNVSTEELTSQLTFEDLGIPS